MNFKLSLPPLQTCPVAIWQDGGFETKLSYLAVERNDGSRLANQTGHNLDFNIGLTRFWTQAIHALSSPPIKWDWDSQFIVYYLLDIKSGIYVYISHKKYFWHKPF